MTNHSKHPNKHEAILKRKEGPVENGGRWRAMPEKFGQWFTIDPRFRRWVDNGVFDRIENELKSQALDIKGIQSLALDSTYVKVHHIFQFQL